MKSRQSFNAHGQRRNAAGASMASWGVLSLFNAALFDTSTTTQGYTGHQQLDPVGLVHMRARLFDPEIGRFLQADDYIEPDATQGLNRYSYVLNNPLTATDPTGNFSLRQALAVVVAVVAAYFGQYWLAKDMLGYAFATAVAGGFSSAYIATGSIKAGLWGALSAAVFFGIGTAFSNVASANARSVAAGTMNSTDLLKSGLTSGQTIAKIAAHAASGGTLNRLQGGKFGHGFISAGFTEALSPAVGQIGDGNSFANILGRTAASAAIGGTASELSGGRFANGATTAAFQQLFNQSIHFFKARKTALIVTTDPGNDSTSDWGDAASGARNKIKASCPDCVINWVSAYTVSEFQIALTLFKNISQIYLIGHSSNHAVYFGSDSRADTNLIDDPNAYGNFTHIGRLNWSNLSPDAEIHIWGCNAAAEYPGGVPIAQSIARYSGSIVYAYPDFVNFDRNSGAFVRWFRGGDKPIKFTGD